MVDRASILQQVNNYYSGKISTHGPVPAGVDWNSKSSQELRFEQLLKLPVVSTGFNINDFGCGYGALYGFLKSRGIQCGYTGYDVSEEMIAAARKLYGDSDKHRFVIGSAMSHTADYVVASGLFNVRGGVADEEWRGYLLETLDAINESSIRGFAFNCLTLHSDPHRMRSDLYYADPCELFDYCRSRYSRSVALLHDYGLYEFTLLVRK